VRLGLGPTPADPRGGAKVVGRGPLPALKRRRDDILGPRPVQVSRTIAYDGAIPALAPHARRHDAADRFDGPGGLLLESRPIAV
jgi:hypothetical protein